jgi:hypothetical protein
MNEQMNEFSGYLDQIVFKHFQEYFYKSYWYVNYNIFKNMSKVGIVNKLFL